MTVEWCGPRWLRPFFGDSEDTIFHRVTAVELVHRQVPDALLKLRCLEAVGLSGCQISSNQLDRLNRRLSLRSLTLHDNHLGDAVKQQPAVAQNPISAWHDIDWGKTSESMCQSDSSSIAFLCPSNPATE